MGKQNWYDYYIILGINHLFKYDDANSEKDNLENRYKKNVTFYENIKNTIKHQSDAFSDCYKNNNNMFDWFLWLIWMNYLVEDNLLKDYLSKKYLINVIL